MKPAPGPVRDVLVPALASRTGETTAASDDALARRVVRTEAGVDALYTTGPRP